MQMEKCFNEKCFNVKINKVDIEKKGKEEFYKIEKKQTKKFVLIEILLGLLDLSLFICGILRLFYPTSYTKRYVLIGLLIVSGFAVATCLSTMQYLFFAHKKVKSGVSYDCYFHDIDNIKKYAGKNVLINKEIITVLSEDYKNDTLQVGTYNDITHLNICFFYWDKNIIERLIECEEKNKILSVNLVTDENNLYKINIVENNE